MTGLVIQLNIKPKTEGECGLPKHAQDEIYVMRFGVVGDYNEYRMRKKEGTLDRALLIYTTDQIAHWNNIGWPVRPGDLGENLTIDGIKYDHFKQGQRYRAGGVEFEITHPSTPCKNLQTLSYVGEERGAHFIKMLKEKRGWYAKVLTEGVISQYDAVVPL